MLVIFSLLTHCFLISVTVNLVLCCMQIFGELGEVGKTLEDDVLDAAPAHGAHDEMQGDISKCPYYAAKMGKHDQTIHAYINYT